MSTETRKAASLMDVAKLAGVSHQTVSRVINRSPLVADATRTKVLAAVTALDYRPNRLARELAGGAVQSVTVLTTDTTLHGSAETLGGIEEAARSAGFSVSISVLDPNEPYSDTDVMARLPHAGSPAIVIAHDETTVRAMRALHQAQPNAVVATGGEHLREEPDDKDWRITLDDRGASFRATRHLLDLGHETVHYLAIPSKAGRRLGWSDALADAGREIPAPVECGWGIGSAYEAAREILVDPSVTAILCGNDDLAFGVLCAAQVAGRSVPGDLSVIGFDDCPYAAYHTPALTTVDLDFRGVGRGAFELLRRRLERRGNRPRPAWRAPELIVRETSGPPRRRTVNGA